MMVILVISLSSISPVGATSPRDSDNLRINGQLENYSYLNDKTPGFSARYLDLDGDNAEYVEVEVGTEYGLNDMWDSGWVPVTDGQGENLENGEQSAPITYAGEELVGTENYWWRIRFKDVAAENGLWSSEYASFNMAYAEFSHEGTILTTKPLPSTNYADLSMEGTILTTRSYIGLYIDGIRIEGKNLFDDGIEDIYYRLDVSVKHGGGYDAQADMLQIMIWDNDTSGLLADTGWVDITNISKGEWSENFLIDSTNVIGSPIISVRFKDDATPYEQNWSDNYAFNLITADLSREGTVLTSKSSPATAYADLSMERTILAVNAWEGAYVPMNMEIDGKDASTNPFASQITVSGVYQNKRYPATHVQVGMWNSDDGGVLYDSGWADIADLNEGERSEEINIDSIYYVGSPVIAMRFGDSTGRGTYEGNPNGWAGTWTDNYPFSMAFADLSIEGTILITNPSPSTAWADLSREGTISASKMLYKFHPYTRACENWLIGRDSAWIKGELDNITNPSISYVGVPFTFQVRRQGETKWRNVGGSYLSDNIMKSSLVGDLRPDIVYEYRLGIQEDATELGFVGGLWGSTRTFRTVGDSITISTNAQWEHIFKDENNTGLRVGDLTIPHVDFEDGIPDEWENEGWTIAVDNVYEGNYSAKNQDIGHGENVTLLVRDVDAEYVSFYYLTSTESNADNLAFYVDNNLEFTASGIMGTWGHENIILAAGEHDFKWVYVKNAAVDDGSDTVWIDKCSFSVIDEGAWVSKYHYLESGGIGIDSLEIDATVPGSSLVRVKVWFSDDGELAKESTSWTNIHGDNSIDLSGYGSTKYVKVGFEIYRGSVPLIHSYTINLSLSSFPAVILLCLILCMSLDFAYLYYKVSRARNLASGAEALMGVFIFLLALVIMWGIAYGLATV